VKTQLNADIENKKSSPYNGGSEKIIYEESEFFSRAKNRIDICIDHTQPQSVIQNEELEKSIFNVKRRNTKTRCVTEITKSNLSFCKELMKVTDRLRHLDGVKANFMESEKEHVLAPLGFSYNGKS
jgi:two-component system, OmpR family, sensor histidine kinase VicK